MSMISETPTINMERLEKMRKEMKTETKQLLKKDLGKLPTIDDIAELFVKYYAGIRARAEAIVAARNDKENI